MENMSTEIYAQRSHFRETTVSLAYILKPYSVQ